MSPPPNLRTACVRSTTRTFAAGERANVVVRQLGCAPGIQGHAVVDAGGGRRRARGHALEQLGAGRIADACRCFVTTTLGHAHAASRGRCSSTAGVNSATRASASACASASASASATCGFALARRTGQAHVASSIRETLARLAAGRAVRTACAAGTDGQGGSQDQRRNSIHPNDDVSHSDFSSQFITGCCVHGAAISRLICDLARQI
jgi:hypothetical protein